MHPNNNHTKCFFNVVMNIDNNVDYEYINSRQAQASWSQSGVDIRILKMKGNRQECHT